MWMPLNDTGMHCANMQNDLTLTRFIHLHNGVLSIFYMILMLFSIFFLHV